MSKFRHDQGKMCNCRSCEPKLHEMLSDLIPVGVKLIPMKKFEVHPDGAKEVEECPFCDEPCEQPHCPYTEKE